MRKAIPLELRSFFGLFFLFQDTYNRNLLFKREIPNANFLLRVSHRVIRQLPAQSRTTISAARHKWEKQDEKGSELRWDCPAHSTVRRSHIHAGCNTQLKLTAGFEQIRTCDDVVDGAIPRLQVSRNTATLTETSMSNIEFLRTERLSVDPCAILRTQ